MPTTAYTRQRCATGPQYFHVLHTGDDLRPLGLAYLAEGGRCIGKITHFSRPVLSQQALSIAWSYELLTETQQQCFQQCFHALGVFVGGWTLEAAEVVGFAEGEKAPEEIILTLAALVDAGLVQVGPSALRYAGADSRLRSGASARSRGRGGVQATTRRLLCPLGGERFVPGARTEGTRNRIISFTPSGQLVFDGKAGGGTARKYTELRIDRVQMGSHGAVADHQLLGDLLVGQPLGHQAQHSAVGKETGEIAHVERWNNTLCFGQENSQQPTDLAAFSHL